MFSVSFMNLQGKIKVAANPPTRNENSIKVRVKEVGELERKLEEKLGCWAFPTAMRSCHQDRIGV